jgi:hypothetical protein
MDLNKTHFLIYLYAVLIGFIYSYSFWSAFNVNIIMYIDIFDLLKFSLKPLLLVTIPLITSVIAIDFLFFHKFKETELDINGEQQQNDLNNAKKMLPYLTFSIAMICAIAFLMYSNNYIDRLIYFGLCISLPVCLLLKNNIYFKFIHSKFLRIFLIYFILIVPWLAYDRGKIYAAEKLSCQNCYGAISYKGQEINGLYIGHINKYFFVKKPSSNDIYVIDGPDLVGINKNTHYLFK